MLFRLCLAGLLAASAAFSEPASATHPHRAKNIVLLLADAGGIPTISAASLMAHGAPQKLFIQSWPSVALSDTTPTGKWVTDSAAGMTAIVTGTKTSNGVISEAPDGKRGVKDGTPLKTILEYAEEHGLSTGVMTNVSIADATPAACYAHANDRGNWGEIFAQIFNPKYGNGVDVVFGVGRTRIWEAGVKAGLDLDKISTDAGRPVYHRLDEVPEQADRAIVVADGEFDHAAAAKRAIRMLSRNGKGFFLMIESDAHTDNIEAGLGRLIAFDKLIRELTEMVNPEETLFLFTADHSFDLRVNGGGPDQPFLNGLRMNNSHTGEEVLVTARGPGSELVHGFLPNTQLFHIMMSAYGFADGSVPNRSR